MRLDEEGERIATAQVPRDRLPRQPVTSEEQTQALRVRLDVDGCVSWEAKTPESVDDGPVGDAEFCDPRAASTFQHRAGEDLVDDGVSEPLRRPPSDHFRYPRSVSRGEYLRTSREPALP